MVTKSWADPVLSKPAFRCRAFHPVGARRQPVSRPHIDVAADFTPGTRARRRAVVDSRRHLGRVTAGDRIERCDDESIGRESRVDSQNVEQGSAEHHRGKHDHDRQRELADDERAHAALFHLTDGDPLVVLSETRRPMAMVRSAGARPNKSAVPSVTVVARSRHANPE